MSATDSLIRLHQPARQAPIDDVTVYAETKTDDDIA